jgi:hypothetical protein
MEISFEWAYTDTPILGIKTYYPISELSLRKRDGTWVSFVFKIDSGADTILMNESDCYDLGYSLDGSEQLDFNTASGKTVRTHVRMLDVKISGYDIENVPVEHVIENVPVAFTAIPLKMLLLGRAKIFETLDVCFLHSSKNTIFAS